MDVLQKEIDEVYATQPITDETLDNRVVEQHRRFIHSFKGGKTKRVNMWSA